MAEVSYMVGITGVFGSPIAENPTKIMMQAGYDALGLKYKYLNFDVDANSLQNAILGARAMGFVGFNCTIPHKVEVLKYLDEVSKEAQIMGAVNTIYAKDGKLIGTNTDGKGFIKAMEEANIALAGKKAVIIGAGGAARAVCVELANNGVTDITILNRTISKGEELVKLLLEKTSAKATFVPFEAGYKIAKDTDLLVNCTNIGLYPDTSCADIDYATISSSMVVCDVIPNPPNTKFLKLCKEKGAVCLDGLGMLVHQGAVAFELWTGEKAPIQVMKDALAKEFGS